MLNIKPRAANAFDLELLIYKGEKPTVAYKLEIHSNGNRLHILCRDKKFKVTTPTGDLALEIKELAETHKITIEA